MSNLGLELAMKDAGITFIRTPVGDRYVVEKMRKIQANLGGEQSGHIVMFDHGTSGDGLITALAVLKILETSGTKQGQELAFNLMTFASTVSVVGFTLDKLEVRLSNLMAFDSKLIGTWGCRPELYPEVLGLVAEGNILIEPFIQTFPLSEINSVFRNTLEHKYNKRSILVPENK